MRRHDSPLPPAVYIVRDGLASAMTAADGAHPNETGGILIGWRTPSAVVIAAALEVADVGASPHRYRRHHTAAQSALANALADEPPRSPLGYVGEWHVHPANHGPSRQDRREIAAISRLVAAPVTLIILAGPPGLRALHALNSSRDRTASAAIEQEEHP